MMGIVFHVARDINEKFASFFDSRLASVDQSAFDKLSFIQRRIKWLYQCPKWVPRRVLQLFNPPPSELD